MATYATEAELAEYVQDNPAIPTVPSGPEAERLLARGERAVDRLCGPGTVDDTTGLRYDPGALTAAQVAALSRATCAAAEWAILRAGDDVGGEDDYMIGADVTILRRAAPASPKAMQELSGSGLVTHSGTVAT